MLRLESLTSEKKEALSRKYGDFRDKYDPSLYHIDVLNLGPGEITIKSKAICGDAIVVRFLLEELAVSNNKGIEVKELALSTKTKNALQAAEIYSLGDLYYYFRKGYSSFTAIRNTGPDGIRDLVNNALKEGVKPDFFDESFDFLLVRMVEVQTLRYYGFSQARIDRALGVVHRPKKLSMVRPKNQA